MYQIKDFSSQVALSARKWNYKHYSTIASELNAIATGLSSDTTKHSREVEKPPAATKIDPHVQTPFTNEVLHIVDRGKAGNLANAAMAAAITAGLANEIPPANTAAPVASGTGTVGQTLSVTNGTWTYTPTSYAYQWLRGGVTISGATAATYVLVAADSGKSVSCRVTATNAAGSTPIASNAIAVT